MFDSTWITIQYNTKKNVYFKERESREGYTNNSDKHLTHLSHSGRERQRNSRTDEGIAFFGIFNLNYN